ncbi:MAG TPA: M99 family carboxypeptidase catalytic domain-containing protein [Syntrophales bacterium]|nr:M99 family carboxypeptidase catalytic domain-containing protein [Syntrophales bacterium]
MADHRRIFILVCVTLVLLLFAANSITVNQTVSSRSEKPSFQVQKFFNGTNQEVTVHFVSGEERGPTLLIFAGIHGDESGGYLTAERYADIKVKRGNLIIVPRLNLPAVLRGKRQGLSGDMNRLFHLPENGNSNPDIKVVDLAKTLIKRADYVLNLHQGSGFYSPTWISPKRNPYKWGQCNVIDALIFDLPNGDKLELANFARRIAARSNSKIENKKFHFQVNNTNTASNKSLHKEQRMSLTYYALYQQHKTALAFEATHNCSLPQAISFLTIAINSMIEEVGMQAENPPSADLSTIRKELTDKKIKT